MFGIWIWRVESEFGRYGRKEDFTMEVIFGVILC
jgi:hypothetical protein